jgi:RNA polymerase sigma-70 factor (ECF subfamily)
MLEAALFVAIAPVIPLRLPEPGTVATDAELVERARGGDVIAKRDLYHRHVRATASRVTRLLANQADAEDAVQDAFYEAFRDIARLRDPARFDAWLMRIAVHQAHRRLRRRRLLQKLGLGSVVDDATLERLAAPNCEPEVRIELTKLDGVLRELGSEFRLAWMLRVVEGCELTEVAALCNCSLATAKRRIVGAHERITQYVRVAMIEEMGP